MGADAVRSDDGGLARGGGGRVRRRRAGGRRPAVDDHHVRRRPRRRRSQPADRPAGGDGRRDDLDSRRSRADRPPLRPGVACRPEPVPLLVALHGGTGSGPQFEGTSGYDGLAEANGFLVVYPDGVGSGGDEDRFRTWNGGVCCGAAAAEDVDDVSFLVQLVEQLSEEHAIDSDRIYATGHSNGMIMSYRWCARQPTCSSPPPGRPARSGSTGVHRRNRSRCCTSTATRTRTSPSTADPGTGSRGPTSRRRAMASGRWPRATAAMPTPAVTSVPPVTTETWTGCDGATTIEFVTVAGASHAWMGADAKTRPGRGRALQRLRLEPGVLDLPRRPPSDGLSEISGTGTP